MRTVPHGGRSEFTTAGPHGTSLNRQGSQREIVLLGGLWFLRGKSPAGCSPDKSCNPHLQYLTLEACNQNTSIYACLSVFVPVASCSCYPCSHESHECSKLNCCLKTCCVGLLSPTSSLSFWQHLWGQEQASDDSVLCFMPDCLL